MQTGALQDFIDRFLPRHFQKELPRAIHSAAIYIKYGALAFLLLMAVAAADLSLFQYFEPFGTIFYFSQSVWLWIILFGFLAGSIFISRFYCRYACPLGAALGVVSMISPFRIKRVRQCVYCKVCEHSCPTGAAVCDHAAVVGRTDDHRYLAGEKHRVARVEPNLVIAADIAAGPHHDIVVGPGPAPGDAGFHGLDESR